MAWLSPMVRSERPVRDPSDLQAMRHKNRFHVDDCYMYLRAQELLAYSKLTSSREKFLLDLTLMSALVDRWRPETHTFQLLCEELTPTLKDVSMISVLPIAGKPLVPEAYSSIWPVKVQDRLCVAVLLTPAVGIVTGVCL
jgi:hypothetical protein